MPPLFLLRTCWHLTGFLCSSEGNKSACHVGDPGSIPRLGGSNWKGHGNPLQVFLPGESHGQKSLAGYSPWGHKESDTSEWLTDSVFLPEKLPGQRRLVSYSPQGCRESDRTERLNTHTHTQLLRLPLNTVVTAYFFFFYFYYFFLILFYF